MTQRSQFLPECRYVRRIGRLSRRVRFDPDPIIDGVVEALFASEISLGRLHRDVSQQELDLLQLASRLMTETSTCPTKVMRRQRGNFANLSFILHYAPDDLGAKGATPSRPALLIDRSRMPLAIPEAAMNSLIAWS